MAAMPTNFRFITRGLLIWCVANRDDWETLFRPIHRRAIADREPLSNRETDWLHRPKRPARLLLTKSRVVCGPCGHGNETAVDYARANFLVWQPENASIVGAVTGCHERHEHQCVVRV